MQFWIILEKETGRYLPETTKHYTGSKLQDPVNRRFPPRLFTNEGSARRALTWWLKGEFYPYTGSDGYRYGPEANPVPGTEREHMRNQMIVREVNVSIA